MTFLLVLIILSCSSASAKADVLFSATFENQDFNGLDEKPLCCQHSAKTVSSPARTGQYAVRFILNSDDAGYIYSQWQDPVHRAMLAKYKTAKIGDIRWYGVSIYVDPSWRDTTRDPNGTIVFQWHRVPDPGEATKSPHLSIQITRDDVWKIVNLSDPNPITTPGSSKMISWNVGNVEKGKWVDWVVHAKWSYKSDGILKVWKDGELLVNYAGPNLFNDQQPEFIMFGVYKARWNHELPSQRNTLTVYFDGIKVGDANSSYNDVAPNGLQSSTPTKPTLLVVK
jgi:hypothetical protein